MDTLAELKRILAASHQRPIKATELDLQRLIVRLESDQEVEKLWRGESLSNAPGGLSYRLIKE